MIKISIIVPFINAEKYIKNCIINLTNLNYEEYEIILIDDGSIDDSKKIIKEYIENDETKKEIIKYYYLEDNTIGVGKARNYGIEKANGKYIMFVDVDDYIDNDLLLKLDKYINEDIDVIKYKMEIIKGDKDKNIKKDKKETNGPIFDKEAGEDAFSKLCFKDKYFDSPCIYLIKKEYIEKNDFKFQENMYHEDFGLIPILIAKAHSVISTDIYGYKYIQTKNSIMRNKNYDNTLRKVNNKIKHYINISKQIKRLDLKDETKQNLRQYYTNSVILSLKELKNKDRKLFKEKIKNLKMIDNINAKNIKQKIKKILLKICINY